MKVNPASSLNLNGGDPNDHAVFDHRLSCVNQSDGDLVSQVDWFPEHQCLFFKRSANEQWTRLGRLQQGGYIVLMMDLKSDRYGRSPSR